MDANDYITHIDNDIKKYQNISVKELTRDQHGKTDFYENIQNMLEQVSDIKNILENIMSDKNELDYGLNTNLGDIKINTLKYIIEHLLERIHVMELLRDQAHH